MVFRHFRIVCIARILLLAATIALLFYLGSRVSYLVAASVGAVAVYQIWGLIHYVERTNRDLTRFLQAIRYEDFSQTFGPTGLGRSFQGLKEAFTEVLNAFKSTRSDREAQARYLQTVVQHVGVGVITFEPDGEINVINGSARRLLRAYQLRNIKQLESFSKPLADTLLNVRTGERALVKVVDNGRLLQLSVFATELCIRDKSFTLVTIQDIQTELEEKEMEAWQDLIRVLTHEIMNSVTPISSLASTIRGLIQPAEPNEHHIDSETIRDVRRGIQTIEKRSQGLLHFVEAYRKLTRIPKPDFQVFLITELFGRVEQLVGSQIGGKAIDFRAEASPVSLELTADPDLVEQVLLNLLRNAVEAVERSEEPRIQVSAKMDGRGRPTIQVKDNGPGIEEEVQQRIFIPFFTTKQEGSGIGLSLCREIMRSHGGTINVDSTPGQGAEFSLRF